MWTGKNNGPGDKCWVDVVSELNLYEVWSIIYIQVSDQFNLKIFSLYEKLKNHITTLYTGTIYQANIAQSLNIQSCCKFERFLGSMGNIHFLL